MDNYVNIIWMTNPAPCYYCDMESVMEYTDNPIRLLCRDHYAMHCDGDPWLELVEIVREAENVS